MPDALACRIDCVTFTRVPGGGRAPLRVGGTEGDGRRWTASFDELVAAIESGARTCYVTFEGHSHLVTVGADAAGRKTLRTLLGELQTLPLAECA